MATGTVTAASATELTVTFSGTPTACALYAVVYNSGVSSGTRVQVVKITPVVVADSGGTLGSLPANSSTMTFTGYGFSATAGSNTVGFNNGAVGTVTGVSINSSTGLGTLTVTFSTRPTTVGSLTATVTTNSQAGTATQVATVKPTVTSSTANLGINADTLIINGFGFSTTPGNNTVVLNNGADGTVTGATATQLIVTFGTKPTSLGNLTATVTTDSQTGTATQVAIVSPAVTSNLTEIAYNAASLVINGFGFDPTGTNTVTFNNGVTGTAVASDANTLTVTFSGGNLTAGNLTAIVSVNGVASGTTGVQVATVKPVVTSSSADLLANATTMTINGFGFSTTPGNNLVTFNDGAVGHVTTATATQLTVTFDTKPATAGSLTATVTTNGVAHGTTAVEVATVKPVVTSSTAGVASNATTMTINGFGFNATTPGSNIVTFSDGLTTGTVTAATATRLTVTFTSALTKGSLSAHVTTGGQDSGAAVQVGIVGPGVTVGTTVRTATATTALTITGVGFNPTFASNTVTFYGPDGTTEIGHGTVTAGSTTSLTVSVSSFTPTGGILYAVVYDGSYYSPVTQVALINPVVTTSTASIGANATTMTINGFGFSTTPGNNSVTFNNGVTGSVTGATATTLTVTFTSLPLPCPLGLLTAIVTTNSRYSGASVNVATVGPGVATSSVAVSFGASTMTINGTRFSTASTNNKVAFYTDASKTHIAAVGTAAVDAAGAKLTVTFTTKPIIACNLYAVVSTRLSATSAWIDGAPTIVGTLTQTLTRNAATNYPTTVGTPVTITLTGFGFDSTSAGGTTPYNVYNTVVFYSDAACTQVVAGTAVVTGVTVTGATTGATSMSVQFTPSATFNGILYAKIAVNGKVMTTGVQVAARLTVT